MTAPSAAVMRTQEPGARLVVPGRQDWCASYEDLEIEPAEIVDFGNGVIIAVVDQKARPVGSSGDVGPRYAVVGVWIKGLVVRPTNYGSNDEAQAAAKRRARERE